MHSNTLRVYRPEEVRGQQNRKSGNPTQPGHRSNASRPYHKRRKAKNIIKRTTRFCKSLNWKGRTVLAVMGLSTVFIIGRMITGAAGTQDSEKEVVITAQEAEPAEYIFKDGNGYPVDWEAITDAWAAEAGIEKRFYITDAERWEIASVVTAEAEGEPFAGKVAVAQCILQTCEDEELRPSDVLIKYSYTKRRPDPVGEALEAVQAVFDFGHVATSEPIKYFYAPALVQSDWHESQIHVMTINNHKFFKEVTE